MATYDGTRPKKEQDVLDALASTRENLDAGFNNGLFPAGVGVFLTPSYSAGNFTGNGSMTWTVDAGDVATYAYRVIGKMMTVAFYLVTTSVGGTLSTALRIAVPMGATIAKQMMNAFFHDDAGGARAVGYINAPTGAAYLELYKINTANWSAATNNTTVFGEITFEIN